MNPIRSMLGIGLLVAAVAATAAGQSNIVNAKLETRAAAGGLDAELKAFETAQDAPGWIGYAIPSNREGYQSCCWNNYSDHERSCGRCSLESEHSSTFEGSRSDKPGSGSAHLEGSPDLRIMIRVAEHRIGKVRTFSADCEVDADGVHVLWLTGVKPAESVAVLSRLVTGGDFDSSDDRKAAHGALAAIAMTGDPSADKALESFVTPDRPEKLRSQTAFWLGNQREAAGLKILERMEKTDPSGHVREQVAFAYTQSHKPRAVDDLIQMAKEDSVGHVRGQAMFWLAQTAGRRAADTIADAIENDPDTAIKKSAVFALTQMPKEEGVPLLIQVAKTNKNREVRKQAFFWLGQTNDPRALAFFEQVLSR